MSLLVLLLGGSEGHREQAASACQGSEVGLPRLLLLLGGSGHREQAALACQGSEVSAVVAAAAHRLLLWPLPP